MREKLVLEADARFAHQRVGCPFLLPPAELWQFAGPVQSPGVGATWPGSALVTPEESETQGQRAS